MRFVPPARGEVDPAVFERPPLSQWREFAGFLRGIDWPGVAALNEFAVGHCGAGSTQAPMPLFVEQTRALLQDGLHYERRIAEQGEIATRPGNWHDLLNALAWLRFPHLKSALNARQVAEIAIVGPKVRTRAQCALTHFDEAGVIVVLRDASLLAQWDAHDWHGLFWSRRSAWQDGRAEAIVFGHALLEHALRPRQLLVGKAIAVLAGDSPRAHQDAHALEALTEAINHGESLGDPQELRPLPLSGIPGWCPENGNESFYFDAPCFRPSRSGRQYPLPLHAERRLEQAPAPTVAPRAFPFCQREKVAREGSSSRTTEG